MVNASERPTVPPWLYKLFTGHQYPYVRRLAKFAQPVKPGEDRPEPTKDMIEAKFWEVYPRCRAKVLQEVKEGMIVVFHDLGEYQAGAYQELVDNPEEFLAKTYGKKKIKPEITGTYKLDDFRTALGLFGQKKSIGKVVMTTGRS